MEIKVKIEDYLSEQEIKEIIEDEIRRSCRVKFLNESEFDRLLVNLSYRFVFNEIDKSINKGSGYFEKLIENKIKDIINDLTEFSVFRKSYSGKSESVGSKLLDKCVSESTDVIKSKVNEVINDYPYHEIKESISDMIYECINEKLFTTTKEEQLF